MKAIRAAIIFALLAGPAQAQVMPNVNLMPDAKSKTPEEKAAEEERDRAYKETLKKIPDAKASNDPWGGMRSEPAKPAVPKAPKTATSARKAKPGSSAN